MQLGVIADDFTGASDIALTLATGGMRTTQFVGIPNGTSDAQAGVIALKSRTIPADQAITQSLAACDWLLDQGVGQIIFKVCSTFDSTPAGNIGQVSQALAARLGARNVVVCPAFPATGRTVFQGHLFVGDRPLHESGMQDHPLTPMTDADLRRVLTAQTDWPVTHIAHEVVEQGADAIRAAFTDETCMVIVDATTDTHLRAIGRACADRVLLTGGSGIAIGLPANFGAVPARPEWVPVTGPGAILSGSCSTATREQVEHYIQNNPAREITAAEVMTGTANAQDIADWAMAQSDPPLIYSSASPDVVQAAQDQFGTERLAAAIEGLFSDLAGILAARGVKRLVVAGGETSGAAVAGLGCSAFDIGPKLANGVPALRFGDMGLALKSGNFGGPDFFAHALAMMEGRA